MNISFLKYSIWLLLANWVATVCILLIAFERTSGQDDIGWLLDLRTIPEQPFLLVFVLSISIFMCIARGCSAFMIYMTHYSKSADSVDWLNENETVQNTIEHKNRHLQLLVSFVLTVAVFTIHYLVGLFVYDLYVVMFYTLLSWLVGLSCLVSIRTGRSKPGLSTYEFAVKNKLLFHSYVILITIVLMLGALVSVILRQLQVACSDIIQCISVAVIQSYDELGEWIVYFWSYDWVIYALLLVFLVSGFRVCQILCFFRSNVLGIYRIIMIVSLLALVSIFVIEQIVHIQHIQLALYFSFFAIASYTAIFLIQDLPKLSLNDSVIRRPEVFDAIVKEAMLKS